VESAKIWKTRDQPKPGSLLGKMRDPGSEVGPSFAMEQLGVVAGNLAVSFWLNFLSIFVHISGSNKPNTVIYASLERSFSPAEVEYR